MSDQAQVTENHEEVSTVEYDTDSEEYVEDPINIPAPVHLRVLESESKPVYTLSTCEVRLCVVKFPRVRERMPIFAENSIDVWENERDFLRNIKPEHPNIVRYFGIMDDFIFMEHCPLGCLEDYVKPGMEIPLREWTLQLCSAMLYLHELGWAHNQLYPCNILVAGEGATLKICDFDSTTPASIPGRGAGPRAPELAITQKQTVDEKVKDAEGHLCDVYCFGLVVWFMQNGGTFIPDNKEWSKDGSILGDRVKSHLELLHVDGLEYADVMRACWAHYKSRPTSKMIMQLLNADA